MIFLLACTASILYSAPTSYITDVSASPNRDEFIVSSDIVCGDQLLTNRVTICRFNEETLSAYCVNVLDGISIQNNVTHKDMDWYSVNTSSLYCEDVNYFFKLKKRNNEKEEDNNEFFN